VSEIDIRPPIIV